MERKESDLCLTKFALRPKVQGVNGRPVSVLTNIYKLEIAKCTNIYQYDVEIEPRISSDGMKIAWSAFESELGKKFGKQIYAAFDGKKNAFSKTVLEEMTVKVKINKNKTLVGDYPPLERPIQAKRGEKPQSSMGQGRGRVHQNRGHDSQQHNNNSRNDKKTVLVSLPVSSSTGDDIIDVTVKIKPTAVINTDALIKFMKKQGPENNDCLHSITAITAFLRYLPSLSFISVGPNLYSPNNRISISGGLEIWRGYHQSIKVLCAGHLGVNVDIAATVFRRGNASMLDLVSESLNVASPEDLCRIPNLTAKISTHFKGVNILVKHIPKKTMRFKITSISEKNAHSFTFKTDDGETNVANYFKKTYGITLKFPKLPLLIKANKSAIPIEVAFVCPSQRFLKKLSPDQIAEMVRCTVMRPKDRIAEIKNATKNSLHHANNKYLESVGLSVSNELLSVKARIINSPSVVFAESNSVNASSGVWKIRGKAVKPAKLLSCAFVFLCNTSLVDAQRIASRIMFACEKLGINVPNNATRKQIVICRGEVKTGRELSEALHIAVEDANKEYKRNCQLVFCVIRKGAKLVNPATSLYDEIKRITLTEMGVLSQCMLQNKVTGHGFNDQYTENLVVKVNIKLGGAINNVDSIPFFDVPTILFGADVTHPHAASIAPSVAAVVASTDKKATRYFTYLRAMPSRQEVITDLHSIASKAIRKFIEINNNVIPKRVIFFRDGVSSGQFAEILESEAKMIRNALDDNKASNCKITFIIVQKRHHVRFFPKSLDEQDSSGNCLPGTVVDDGITHPFEYNFFLQSHSGIQGTSRPTLYHVLLDENSIGIDSMQKLCYNLCFLSERATRSISIVSPVYRAHLAAFVGRIFLKCDYDLDSTSTHTPVSRDLVPVLVPVMQNIQDNTMYYM